MLPSEKTRATTSGQVERRSTGTPTEASHTYTDYLIRKDLPRRSEDPPVSTPAARTSLSCHRAESRAPIAAPQRGWKEPRRPTSRRTRPTAPPRGYGHEPESPPPAPSQRVSEGR